MKVCKPNLHNGLHILVAALIISIGHQRQVSNPSTLPYSPQYLVSICIDVWPLSIAYTYLHM